MISDNGGPLVSLTRQMTPCSSNSFALNQCSGSCPCSGPSGRSSFPGLKNRNVGDYERAGSVSDRDAAAMTARQLRQDVAEWLRTSHPHLLDRVMMRSGGRRKQGTNRTG